MSIKYICDDCGREYNSCTELAELSVKPCVGKGEHNNPLSCHLCRECKEKITKPIKHWQTNIRIIFPDD